MRASSGVNETRPPSARPWAVWTQRCRPAAVIGVWLSGRNRSAQRRRVVAVDGKTLRGAKRDDGRQVHCLPQWTTPPAPSSPNDRSTARRSEVPSLRPLLADLDVAGAVVTADALQIHRQAAEFLVAGK